MNVNGKTGFYFMLFFHLIHCISATLFKNYLQICVKTLARIVSCLYVVLCGCGMSGDLGDKDFGVTLVRDAHLSIVYNYENVIFM